MCEQVVLEALHDFVPETFIVGKGQAAKSVVLKQLPGMVGSSD